MVDVDKEISIILNNHIKYLKFSPNKTDLQFFVSKNDVLEDSKSFRLIFPKLFTFLENFHENYANYLKEQSLKYPSYTEHLFSDHNASIKLVYEFFKLNLDTFNNELSSYMPEWIQLLKTEPRTSYHILVVLVMVYYDLYKIFHESTFTNYDRNILLWSSLMHDISKHQKINDVVPIQDDDKRDKIHPFKSGATTLKVFFSKNLFKYKNKENLELLISQSYDLLAQSYKIEPVKKKYYIHDNSNLDKLNQLFDEIIKEDQSNLDLIEIVKLVTFHQSLPNVSGSHSHVSLLGDKQIQLFFDIRDIELMRVLMCNDSLAHSFFTSPYLVHEINEKISHVRNELLLKAKIIK